MRIRILGSFVAGTLLLASGLASADRGVWSGTNVLVPLGEEFAVNAYTTWRQTDSDVAVLPDGGFVVVWDDNRYGGYDVLMRRFASDGAPVGGEFLVNADTYLPQRDPSVAAGVRGEVLVVWEAGGWDDIRGQRYRSDGTPDGSDFLVSAQTSGRHQDPRIAMGPAGEVVAVWGSEYGSSSDRDIRARRFSSSGAALGAELEVNSDTTGIQTYPAVAVSPSGGFVVAWLADSLGDSVGKGVWARRFDSDGAPLDNDFGVSSEPADTMGTVAIGATPSGGFVVVWDSGLMPDPGEAADLTVRGQRFDSEGDRLGGEFRVETYTTGAQFDPVVATDGADGFIVVWTSAGVSFDSDVRARRLASDGSFLGPEIVVSEKIPSGAAAVASTPRGEWVVSYSDFSRSDGSYTDVRARRLGVAVFVDGFETGSLTGWSSAVSG